VTSVRIGDRCIGMALVSGVIGGVGRARLDLVAGTASVLALAMLGLYVWIIREQHGELALWAVGALLLGALAAAYGAVGSSPHRRASLVLAGVTLLALGTLAILSIGLPILLAGALCVIASMRQSRVREP
jgi:hypothetical protein